MKKSIIGVVAASAILTVGIGVGAEAGDLITGKDIKDGSVAYKDLSDKAHTKLKGNVGATGAQGIPGKNGIDGKDGKNATFAGAVYRVEDYLNGGGGSATVACADDNTESQKYVAVSGGVQGSESGVSETQAGFLVSSSFPGRMDWSTGKPKVDSNGKLRTDGWIVFGNSQHTSTLRVWVLCVPKANFGGDLPVVEIPLDN